MERIFSACFRSPRMKRAAAKASREESLKGFPKFTGFAARRKGRARLRRKLRMAEVSRTAQEQSRTEMDRAGMSAGESACSAVGSRRMVLRGRSRIRGTIRTIPDRASFFTEHFLGSQVLSR